ncbi:hypothetical protein U1Q18_025408, partial [Sarracenia purpurea var. burkii]
MPQQQPHTTISNVSNLDTTVTHFPDITSPNNSTSCASHPNSNSHAQPNISNISHSHPHQNISNSLPQQNISNSHPHLSNLQTTLPTTTSVYPSSSSAAFLSPSNSISNSPPTLVPPTTSIHDSRGLNLIVDLNSTSPPSSSSFVPKCTHPMVLRNMSTPKALLTQPSSLSSSHPNEPTCFTTANKSPVWRQAMTDEINALIRNDTW